jgi:hypothetical protein
MPTELIFYDMIYTSGDVTEAMLRLSNNKREGNYQ